MACIISTTVVNPGFKILNGDSQVLIGEASDSGYTPTPIVYGHLLGTTIPWSGYLREHAHTPALTVCVYLLGTGGTNCPVDTFWVPVACGSNLRLSVKWILSMLQTQVPTTPATAPKFNPSLSSHVFQNGWVQRSQCLGSGTSLTSGQESQ